MEKRSTRGEGNSGISKKGEALSDQAGEVVTKRERKAGLRGKLRRILWEIKNLPSFLEKKKIPSGTEECQTGGKKTGPPP